MKQKLFITIISLLIISTFSGCSTVPDREDVQQIYDQDQHYISVVVDYLSASEYKNITIRNASGYMVTKDGDVKIPDGDVLDAIHYLMSKQDYYYIGRYEHTIKFEVWYRDLGQIACGFTCSTNDNKKPYIQYATELTPMDEEGWFYFVDDYNTWRTQH